ncbi:ergosterol biosynthesis ERG4/ERG24 family domain-containing protein [Trichoderma evansii]
MGQTSNLYPSKILYDGRRSTRKHLGLQRLVVWWGKSRHANYVGVLMLSAAMCAIAGTPNRMVWLYAIFMLILLVHRYLRDEERCQTKYGQAWKDYCEEVPWRLVPGIW